MIPAPTLLGLRLLETKTSTIRLFLQIWDSKDDSVAWEGAQESTVSHESLAEEYVSMKNVVQESARDLVTHLPQSGLPAPDIVAKIPEQPGLNVTSLDDFSRHNAMRHPAHPSTP